MAKDTTKTGYTRFEYIGPGGRMIVLYGNFIVWEQDNGKTVKVFGDKDVASTFDLDGYQQ